MKINRNQFLCGLAALAAISLPTGLFAATNGFMVPPFRGSANSQSGYWEVFTSAVGAPGNAADQPGATTSARLFQTNTNGFLTGTGNIYNFTDANAFILTNTTPFTLGTVVLQTRSGGSEMDYASVSLSYTNDEGTHTLAPLFRYETDRGSGVSSLFQWDLTGLGVTAYSISFAASGSSMSFDSMTLDTADQFSPVFADQPFFVKSSPAALARWMYPFNAAPANRSAASVFAAFGSAGSFDTRDAQFLVGWNTTNQIPAGQGARNYLIRRVRVTLTVSSGNQYAYSGTLRDYRSYFPTNDPRYVAPASTGVPVELFGAGYRGGYTAATFQQATTFYANPAAGDFTNRTAYAAGFDTNGVLVDVSNNVGDDETNEIANAFEVAPFAVGQSTNVAPGQLMPVGSKLTFDLNLDDPLIYSYVQNGLDLGKLNFMASALLSASFSGPPNYPNFYTIFNSLAAPDEYPLLDIEGAIVRTNVDSDADGVPDDWENYYFGSLANNGAGNQARYLAGTNPNKAVNDFHLLSVQHDTNAAEIHFNVAPNRQYSVQWSGDLKNWQSVTNPAFFYTSDWLTKIGTHVTYPAPVYGGWRDTNAASDARFYRLGVQ